MPRDISAINGVLGQHVHLFSGKVYKWLRSLFFQQRFIEYRLQFKHVDLKKANGWPYTWSSWGLSKINVHWASKINFTEGRMKVRGHVTKG